MDKLLDFAFVRLGRSKLKSVQLLPLLHQVPSIHSLLLVVEDPARCETNEQVLLWLHHIAVGCEFVRLLSIRPWYCDQWVLKCSVSYKLHFK